jgi:hypothetical protein
MIAREDFTEADLTAGIYIRSIKIIDTGVYCLKNLLLGFFNINSIAFSGKTHASKTKD